MIQAAPGTKVHLACRPVSMRYGFDGLAAQVATVLNEYSPAPRFDSIRIRSARSRPAARRA
jgi:hypothetical protein